MSIQNAEWYEAQSRCAKRKVGCVVGNAKGALVGWGCNHGTLEECTCKHDAKNPNVRHAEVMAIGSASESLVNGVMYVTYGPCLDCARAIVDAGIMKVVYRDDPSDDAGLEYLKKYHVEVKQIKG